MGVSKSDAALLAELAALQGEHAALPGAVKSIQRVSIAAASVVGSGANTRYYDLTISAISTTRAYAVFVPTLVGCETVQAWLSSSTNVRLRTYDVVNSFYGEMYVVEMH